MTPTIPFAKTEPSLLISPRIAGRCCQPLAPLNAKTKPHRPMLSLIPIAAIGSPSISVESINRSQVESLWRTPRYAERWPSPSLEACPVRLLQFATQGVQRSPEPRARCCRHAVLGRRNPSPLKNKASNSREDPWNTRDALAPWFDGSRIAAPHRASAHNERAQCCIDTNGLRTIAKEQPTSLAADRERLEASRPRSALMMQASLQGEFARSVPFQARPHEARPRHPPPPSPPFPSHHHLSSIRPVASSAPPPQRANEGAHDSGAAKDGLERGTLVGRLLCTHPTTNLVQQLQTTPPFRSLARSGRQRLFLLRTARIRATELPLQKDLSDQPAAPVQTKGGSKHGRLIG